MASADRFVATAYSDDLRAEEVPTMPSLTAFDAWPWPSGGAGPPPRCYAVTAVSPSGLEGPMSIEACGSPPGP